MQRQAGHVVAEDDLVRARGVVEVRHGLVGFVQDGVRGAAGGECAAVVGVALEQVAVDAVKGVVGDLGAARVVEEDGLPVEGGELGADGGKVKGHGWVSVVRVCVG